ARSNFCRDLSRSAIQSSRIAGRRRQKKETWMLHYRRHGNGTPLIMQHGFLGGSGYWVPQFPALGKVFDIIAPDLPGFAGSAAEPAQDSIEGIVAAVSALVYTLRIDITHTM